MCSFVILINLLVQEFFPKLSYNVLRDLPASWRPVIYNNPRPYQKPLNDFETANFILQQCIGLDIPDRPNWAEALSLLADIVLHRVELPRTLQAQLIDIVSVQEFPHFSEVLASYGQANDFLKEVWGGSFRLLQAKPSWPTCCGTVQNPANLQRAISHFDDVVVCDQGEIFNPPQDSLVQASPVQILNGV